MWWRRDAQDIDTQSRTKPSRRWFAPRLDWLELKGFCDGEPKRLARLADEYGVPERYTRYEDLLSSDIDFVFIATPPELDAQFGLDIALPGIAAVESIRQGGVPVEVPSV